MDNIIQSAYNWFHCHKCDSDQTEGGHAWIDRTQAWRRVACLECGATWTEVYQATHREEEKTA